MPVSSVGRTFSSQFSRYKGFVRKDPLFLGSNCQGWQGCQGWLSGAGRAGGKPQVLGGRMSFRQVGLLARKVSFMYNNRRIQAVCDLAEPAGLKSSQVES